MSADLKAAYARLEAAIREVGELEGFEGVMTEWVVKKQLMPRQLQRRIDPASDDLTSMVELGVGEAAQPLPPPAPEPLSAAQAMAGLTAKQRAAVDTVASLDPAVRAALGLTG
ncbi:hypothetical protein [Streptomyces sp. SYSU K21746]